MSNTFDANIDSVDGWGVLLVNACNPFNSFNHIAMLLHAYTTYFVALVLPFSLTECVLLSLPTR